MKRVFMYCMALTLCMPIYAVGQYFTVGDNHYTYDSSDANKHEVYLNGWTYSGRKEVHIPSYVKYKNITYKVVGLTQGTTKRSPFSSNPNFIEKIELPPTIKYICPIAFNGLENLKNIDLPDSVVNIGAGAFNGCSKLTSITLPRDLETLGTDAFSGCTALQEILVNKNNNFFISQGGVLYNKNKTKLIACPKAFTGELSILPTTTQIADFAFNSCSNISSVIIPDKVTEIGNNSFYNCTKLVKLEIPKGISSIGEAAFSGCIGVSSLCLINDGEVNIGWRAFANCPNLTEVSIVSNISCVNIGTEAFSDCSSLLSSIIQSKKATDLSSSAFKNCVALKEISLLHKTGQVGDWAFVGCTGLEKAEFSSIESLCKTSFIRDNSNPLFFAKHLFIKGEVPEEIIIPPTVESIGQYTFCGCESIKSVYVSEGVKTIGRDAFVDCKALEFFFLPSSFREAKGNSWGASLNFSGCTNLKQMVLLPYNNNTSWKYKIPEGCIALVPSLTMNSYNGTVYPLENTTQSKIIIPKSDYYTPMAAKKGQEWKKAENDTIMFDDIPIDFMDTLTISGYAFGKYINGEITVKTKPITMSIELIRATNLTLTVRGTYDAGDGKNQIDYTKFGNEEYGTETTYTGLFPGQKTYVGFYVIMKNGRKSSIGESFQTIPIKASLTTEVGSTTCKMSGNYSGLIDATIISSGFAENDYHSDVITICGLDPNTTYNNKYAYKVNIKEGGSLSQSVSFKTKALELKSLTPKVTNKGEAIVCATTNIADEETNVGFEWRKIDAPDVIPSKTGAAVIYNGTMEGMIKNLDTSAYWKVRPYYESAASNKYYGEWVGFDPSDFSFFEPTVHTYANVVVTEGTAILTGYVMAGTDAVKEQGFEYWAINGNNVRSNRAEGNIVQKVIGTGQKMVVQLSDLYAGTKYNYRAYVKTSRGTTYGEEMSFTTKDHVIDAVESATTEEKQLKIVGYYNLQGRRLSKPEQGKLNIIRYSDGTIKKIIFMP